MDTPILQRLKEGIAQQRQDLMDWLSRTPSTVRQLRAGPAGERGVEDHLRALDTAFQKAEEQTLGICDVCHDYVDTSRLEMDYTACVCIEHLSGEERTQLENELELSQKVQQALLPHSTPQIRGLSVAAFSQPAHIVGGDYFDFLRFRDGSHVLVIADVMGKGMPASMLMASLQASLRIIAPESAGPAEVVARLNHIFCHNIRLTKFVTLFLARYEETTRTLTYCNAGHNPPLVYRPSGKIEELLPTGAAIGLVEHGVFEESHTTLSPDDVVLFYTDGVVESRDPKDELFGQERLEEFLRRSSALDPLHIISSLREDLRQFSKAGGPIDDTTVIAVRATR
jgi:phosphoserine phosphatase RsbU/P